MESIPTFSELNSPTGSHYRLNCSENRQVAHPKQPIHLNNRKSLPNPRSTNPNKVRENPEGPIEQSEADQAYRCRGEEPGGGGLGPGEAPRDAAAPHRAPDLAGRWVWGRRRGRGDADRGGDWRGEERRAAVEVEMTTAGEVGKGRSFCLFEESRAFHGTILPFRFEDSLLFFFSIVRPWPFFLFLFCCC